MYDLGDFLYCSEKKFIDSFLVISFRPRKVYVLACYVECHCHLQAV